MRRFSLKIHEYQAVEILKSNNIKTPIGYLAANSEEAKAMIAKLQTGSDSKKVVVKAQIHAGGRGKGGGVKLCSDSKVALSVANEILGMNLVTPQTSNTGQKVRKILITEAVDIESEFYLAVTLNRQDANHIIIASKEGGVEIEDVASSYPDQIIKESIDPIFGLQRFQAFRIAEKLGFQEAILRQATQLILNLYSAFVKNDASLAEINPLVLTKQKELIALDGKFDFDDNALYRQANIAEMRDPFEEDETEMEASKYNLNYIKLEGNVGCMVNGAGLAMATMDIIKLKGGEPANFLDVGGGANVETVKNGFRIILSDKNVTAVLINIFGGIVRCDRVANGIIAAVEELDLKVPVVVRLEGTNAKEAKQILSESDVSISPATTLDEAAEKVVEAASK